MHYVTFKDIIACFVFLLMAPIALIAKIFVHNYWLVGEEPQEARDNGYWFFKYVRENHPEQKIAYVIKKKSPDYQKVKALGKVIEWGSISHWFWYLTAKKNISSQKGCKPNAAACYLFETKLKIWRNKRYFLQHGITINDGKWLYYDKCRFKLFVCGARPEYDFIKEKFGYPDGAVQELGFCRFDGLTDTSADKKIILVMPTWRSYLVRAHGSVTDAELKKTFTESDYFIKWSEFLTDPALSDALKRDGYTLLFYPHRNMQRFLDSFSALKLPECVCIAKPNEIDVQTAMKMSKLLITDYSSVIFDFAYMQKPVLLYQFDEKLFRETQYGEGYFNYRDNPISSWHEYRSTLIAELDRMLQDGVTENSRSSEFFSFHDTNNCKRNYEAVKAL